MRLIRPLVLLATAATLTAACQQHRVTLTFRPADGARYRYEITVDSTSDLEVEGRPPEHRQDRVVLLARHRVLSTGSDGSRVEVTLRPEAERDGTVRTFVVSLDRAAQLAEVQRVEGLPADVLGDLGLGEIFPAAAGAPPARRLGTGSRWTIDEPLRLPGLAPTRLRGKGRLTRLGTTHGRAVATIATTTDLAVRRSAETGDGRVELVGPQHTRSTATHLVADGSVESAEAEATGDFRLRIMPPQGDGTVAVGGRLRVRVHTVTRRLR